MKTRIVEVYRYSRNATQTKSNFPNHITTKPQIPHYGCLIGEFSIYVNLLSRTTFQQQPRFVYGVSLLERLSAYVSTPCLKCIFIELHIITKYKIGA